MVTVPKLEISNGLLRTLHRIHRQVTDLQNRIDRGPRQIQAGEALVGKAEMEFEQAKAALKKMRVASDERQLQLKTREAKINDLQAKLNAAASNREYSMLKEQIAADEQANLVLSDEIFEQLEQLDLLQAEVEKAEAELAKQKADQQKRIEEVTAKAKDLQVDLKAALQQLQETETKIPSQIRPEYNRLIASRGEDALAPTEEGSCGGCYQTLNTQIINQLQLSLLVKCPNCNCVLYLPEDTRLR